MLSETTRALEEQNRKINEQQNIIDTQARQIEELEGKLSTLNEQREDLEKELAAVTALLKQIANLYIGFAPVFFNSFLV